MATFVTVPELKAALSAQGGAGARTAASLPDARLTAAIDEAQDEVTGKLSGRYVIPTDPALMPAFVAGIILAVAAYVATLEWMQGKDLADRDPVVLRYARARANLKDIVDGHLAVQLDPVAGGPVDSDMDAYNAVPDMELVADVSGPTYGGLVAGNWQGGGIRWQ